MSEETMQIEIKNLQKTQETMLEDIKQLKNSYNDQRVINTNINNKLDKIIDGMNDQNKRLENCLNSIQAEVKDVKSNVERVDDKTKIDTSVEHTAVWKKIMFAGMFAIGVIGIFLYAISL